MSAKVILAIIDGWGIGNGSKSDAVKNASTPFLDSLFHKYPNATLLTSGEDVGLPQGQMGNSEVGHLNIGAGRVIYQDLVKINKAISNQQFEKNKQIIEAFSYAKNSNKKVHLVGLVSDGGVHSHQNHLYKLCEMASNMKLNKVYIHAFTDGRDTDPKSALGFITNLQKKIENTKIQLASLVGRYYSMDRDKRWERIKIAYDLLVKGIGTRTTNILSQIQKSYDSGITDEFIKPIVMVDSNNNPLALIEENDVVICFNYRTDRCREITEALTQKDMPDVGMKKLKLFYLTMTRYDDSYSDVKVIFDKDNLNNTLGEIISKNEKKQLRAAETEKYPHVTFFFSGGREDVFKNEKRLLVPSPKVNTYDLKPEMSAVELTNNVLKEIEGFNPDFVCINYANADMVGHTGNYNAVVKAIETVDSCLNKLVLSCSKMDYSFLIIADHGNADYMINEDGSPNTAHTTNPVPCIIIDDRYKAIKSGKLADIAPTILTMLGIAVPKEMDGMSLV